MAKPITGLALALLGLSAAVAFSPAAPTLRPSLLAPRSPALTLQSQRRDSSLARSRRLSPLQCNGAGEKNWLDAAKIGAAAITGACLMGLYAGSVPLPATFPGGEMLAKSIEQTKLQPAQADFLQGEGKLSELETNTINLFRETRPSVVNINSFSSAQQVTLDIERMPVGTGSGIVWDTDGHIVTNFHVVQNAVAASVTVTAQDGQQTVYKATLTGVDPDKDIAVLKIDAKLRPVTLSKTTELQVGQSVFAIGNPFGLDHSLTKGIISGLGRETKSPTGRTITNVVQTDAAINPGNSGGALLDSGGNLVGMNTAILSTTGGSSGIGFAIPSDTIKAVVKGIISGVEVRRPVIGITFLESQSTMQLSGVKGVLVLDVPRGSPAAKAGIKPTVKTIAGVELGDIVVGINGTPITGEADLLSNIEKFKPGDVIKVTVLRGVGESGGKATFKQMDMQVEVGAAGATNLPKF